MYNLYAIRKLIKARDIFTYAGVVCRTGVYFLRILVEQRRQRRKRSERETRVAREGRGLRNAVGTRAPSLHTVASVSVGLGSKESRNGILPERYFFAPEPHGNALYAG